MEKWKTALLRASKYVKANDFKEFLSTNQEKSKAYFEKLGKSLQSKPNNGIRKEVLETKDDNKLTTTKSLLLKLKEQGSERAGAFLKSENLQMFKSKKKELSFRRMKRQAILTLIGMSIGSALYRYVKLPFRFLKNSLILAMLGTFFLQVKYYKNNLKFLRKASNAKKYENLEKTTKYFKERAEEIRKRLREKKK